MTTVTVHDGKTWYELSSPQDCGWAHVLDEISDYDPAVILPGNSHPRGPIRWPLIAEFITYGLELLRHDAIEFDGGIGSFEYDLSGFSRVESEFAKDWFYRGAAVDPWNSALSNGRHRLAWIWRYVPGLSVPIKSDVLLASPEDQEPPDIEIRMVREGLAVWQDRLAPTDLNRRYVANLRRRYGLSFH